MKISEIKVGTSYGVCDWVSTGRGAHTNWDRSYKITVTDIKKESVKTRGYGWNATRNVSVVYGTDASGNTIKTEARKIVGLWDEIQAARDAKVQAKTEFKQHDRARREQLDPQLAALEAYLQSKGAEPRYREYATWFVNSEGRAVQDTPDDWYEEGNDWERVSEYLPATVLDREAILKSGNVTLPLTTVVGLLPPF